MTRGVRRKVNRSPVPSTPRERIQVPLTGGSTLSDRSATESITAGGTDLQGIQPRNDYRGKGPASGAVIDVGQRER